MHDYITRLSSFSRLNKVVVQLTLDAVLIAVSFVLAMAVRLESLRFLANPAYAFVILTVILMTLAVFWFWDLYRILTRFLTGHVLISIGIGAIASATALYLTCLAFGVFLPRSVPVMHAAFVFLSVGGLRFTARHILRSTNHTSKRPVIIYGAGEAGLQLLTALSHGRDYLPVALVDDDEQLHNMTVGGLRVVAGTQIASLIQKTGVKEVLLAMPSIKRTRRRAIVAELQELNLEIKMIPGMSDIVSGKAEISDLHDVTAEDLLGRDPVPADPDLMRQNIASKVVMVSGAGGSIGSELCRQIIDQEPSTLLLYEVSEFALYTIEAELSATTEKLQRQIQIVPILGSLQHTRRLEKVIETFGVQTIYHAAAYKHVPLVEENVVEGIRNNVFGTLAIAKAAAKLGVENFILISTDKAVRPTSIMGATKRIAELICQAHAQENNATSFSMVRFGNVLGSSGSVIPKFQEQIENGGPITITHPDINRYFMTIREAAQLVIQAGAMSKGGDVFVLDMGEPVKIMDLAMTMVRLHGMAPYIVDDADGKVSDKGDIPIRVTGLRKGEKLFEELLIGNDPSPTRHPRVMTASDASLSMAELKRPLDQLLKACEEFNLETIAVVLDKLPLAYTPGKAEVSDILWRTTDIYKNRPSDNLENALRLRNIG